MEYAGQLLRRARERLNLKFRDVELASQIIAERHDSQEFVVLISRLSEIESHGTLPSIYRLYSLCTIYRLDMNEVLTWYGVGVDAMAADTNVIAIQKTHAIGFGEDGGAEVTVPISITPGIDLTKTSFLSAMIKRWGKLPLALLGGADVKRYRYGYMGTDDWSMYPTLPPGSMLVIDDSRRKIQMTGWTSFFDRPIYFLEDSEGYYCRWCSLLKGVLSLVPDPSSTAPVLTFEARKIEVIGQVVGVAINLDPERQLQRRA